MDLRHKREQQFGSPGIEGAAVRVEMLELGLFQFCALQCPMSIK
jgi:hypothetical protein